MILRCEFACSEGHTSLPWNKIVLGQQLRFRLAFSAGELNYAVQNLLAHLLDGLLSRNNAARVDVDDVRHLLHELRVRGDFHYWRDGDRKSTRLNSSHLGISYAVFCLKKKSHIRTVR